MPEHATVPRRRTAPVHPRRVSGPTRPRIVPSVALPQRGRTGAFERLRALPDTRVVDRLLRGRVCIWVIGIMLGGIVAMQVSLLRLNAGISRAVLTAGTLVRENADLETAIAKRTSGDLVRSVAAKDSMVDPPAGDMRYLRAHPLTDPALALKRIRPPSVEAAAIMGNFGRVPGALAAAAVPGTQAIAGVAGTIVAPAATPVPTAVATPPAPQG